MTSNIKQIKKELSIVQKDSRIQTSHGSIQENLNQHYYRIQRDTLNVGIDTNIRTSTRFTSRYATITERQTIKKKYIRF